MASQQIFNSLNAVLTCHELIIKFYIPANQVLYSPSNLIATDHFSCIKGILYLKLIFLVYAKYSIEFNTIQ